jgi:hypothetical protein
MREIGLRSEQIDLMHSKQKKTLSIVIELYEK